ncbi:TonB-dependent receptor [Mucilaginibacter mali]|uniref:TonB-dependent receptor n=1 Tax=Mucilaginibacter mali TaxID=2740462 RepID=A0A7D4UED2_9SPHI|nr:TonB-dependent receptor [Mucilaginibacter mali]QKJ28796.1 TonB-dependent receptor [Mucilaginibacter mali]
MRKHLLILFLAVFSITGFTLAQGTKVVTGKLLDAQTKEPLIGATVNIKGTTKATSVALDGSFKISVPADGSTTLVLSYIGYVTKEIEASGKALGTITLDQSSAAMKEVVITGTQSIAIGRQTPIAVSAVNAQYIEEKGAGAEFPELLQETPGVTVSRSGGGYGDSRINIRGFSSNNVALLINGIPVNDVEAGKIYWNDWAGLSDVTTSMQVQRGLGASKIPVPSLGGTINITTMGTQTQTGGSVAQSIGSYDQLKTVVSYSTGLSDKGWSSSFLLSKSTGTSPGGEALYYTGYSYFLNISKVLSKTQSLSFNFLGAAQSHAQRYTYNTINTYRMEGTRFNTDYGYYGGQLLSAEQNFYNKPLASINHDWQINPTTSLATVAYATYGAGAARYVNSLTGVPRIGNQYSPIDFNAISKNNLANADGSSKNYFQDVENDHQQYGILSTLNKKIGNYVNIVGGLDLRYYRGEHFYKVHDLLGGSYIIDTRNNSRTSPSGDINNPNKQVVEGDKFNNDYLLETASEGIYLQSEYTKNNLSAFVAVAGTNTGNRRTDYFNYLASDPNRTSKWINFLGYQAKGGANYNLDAHNNVYANVGYLVRSPLVATIFLNKQNDVNPSAKPEKLMSYELGYGYVSPMFSANVNLYRSTYKDRAKITSNPNPNNDGTIAVANISGINELHQGIEFEGKFRPSKDVTFSGSFSVGDFHYLSNTGAVQITSDAPGSSTTTQPSLLLKDLKIGEFGSNATGAQTTAAFGADITVLPKVKIGGNYTYYARYYGSYDPTKITATGYSVYNIPDYGTLNMNLVFRFKFAGLDASFIGNVYNVLNTQYIADAYDTGIPGAVGGVIADSPVAQLNRMNVWYGANRYYMTTLKIKF